jgi:hypothetical protein
MSFDLSTGNYISQSVAITFAYQRIDKEEEEEE